MAESVAQFAARIKAKYPDYAQVPDAELVQRIVTKYPQYQSAVDLGQPGVSKPQIEMEESTAPKVVRAATGVLPAAGAIAGGAAASPGVVTTAVGSGLGAAAGEQARLLANRALFGNEETSPISKEGLERTAVEGGVTAATGLALGGAQKLAENLPGTKSYMAKAGQKFQEVMGAAGDMPVDVSGAGTKALEINDYAARGGSRPKIINDFIKRVTDPEKGPLTYAEARDFESNASRLSADEAKRLTPKVRFLLNQFRSELRDAVAQTAAQAGKQQAYQEALKSYARGAAAQELAGTAKDLLTKEALKGVAKGAGIGAGGALGYEIYRQTR